MFGQCHTPMSSSNPRQKIGGEYGEVRANTDVDRLSKYLNEHAKEVSHGLMLKVGRGGSIGIGYNGHGLGLLTFLRLESMDRYASYSVASGLFGNI